MKKESYEKISLRIEKELFKLTDIGFQRGELHALLDEWITTHAPGCIEQYSDGGGAPIFFYGSMASLLKIHGLRKNK